MTIKSVAVNELSSLLVFLITMPSLFSLLVAVSRNLFRCCSAVPSDATADVNAVATAAVIVAIVAVDVDLIAAASTDGDEMPDLIAPGTTVALRSLPSNFLLH